MHVVSYIASAYCILLNFVDGADFAIYLILYRDITLY